jgi:LysM repeat protein
MVRLRSLAIVLTLWLLAWVSISAIAQSTPTTCPELVEQAFTALTSNCPILENNTACYAYSGVDVTPADAASPPLFTLLGDRLALSKIASIHASAPDLASGRWGVGVLKLGLPQPLNAAGNILILGDTTIDKLEDPEASSWSINFHSSFDQPQCAETPALLIAQSLDNNPLDLVINGASVRVTSATVFRWTSENSLAAIISGGQLAITGGSTAGAGQTLVAVTDSAGQVMFWSAPRESTAEEIRSVNTARAALSRIGFVIPPAVIPPTAIPVTPTPQATATIPQCSSTTTHIVEDGENLFRIALRYNTTVDAIVAANHLENRDQIEVGQKLVIPCGAESSANDAPANGAPADNTRDSPPPDSLNCASLLAMLPPNATPQLLAWIRQNCMSG